MGPFSLGGAKRSWGKVPATATCAAVTPPTWPSAPSPSHSRESDSNPDSRGHLSAKSSTYAAGTSVELPGFSVVFTTVLLGQIIDCYHRLQKRKLGLGDGK